LAVRENDHVNMPSGSAPWNPFQRESLEEDFLRPDEGNFSLLADRVLYLQQELTNLGHVRPGMRDMPGIFSYSDTLSGNRLPEQSQPRSSTFKEALEAFEGTFRPHHPHSLFNVAPSPMIDTAALGALVLINNPNAIWDLSSGKFTLIEQRIAQYLGELADWNTSCDGAFTSGGKATLMYAVKLGINRCDPSAVEKGLRGKYLLLTSSSVHFSLESVCNFAGLGTKACVRIPSHQDGTIDISALKLELTEGVKNGFLLAGVILAGGPLIDTMADPIKAVRDVVEDVAAEMNLIYTPMIHIDCVVTWPWLAFRRGHGEEAPALSREVLLRIRRLAAAVKEVKYADSFGVDFHKTGLSPYPSSCFIVKDATAFRRINYRPEDSLPHEDSYGQFCSFDRTLENSRSCIGIISAYYVLRRLGWQGLRQYIMRWMEISDTLRQLIRTEFRHLGAIVNERTLGVDVVLRLSFGMEEGLAENLEDASCSVQDEYSALAMGFREWTISSVYCRCNPVPALGYVPLYRSRPSAVALPAFLLYPNSLYSFRDELADVLSSLSNAVSEFLIQKEHIPLGRMDWEGRPLPPR
jgi:glutamate/tyrosine decarboxylase-like PLP-dependent enzyme